MTLLVLVVIVALAVAFVFLPGLGLLAILPAVLAVGVTIWLVSGVARGRTPRDMIRRTRGPELLGPGGPDDPDRSRR